MTMTTKRTTGRTTRMMRVGPERGGREDEAGAAPLLLWLSSSRGAAAMTMRTAAITW